MNELGLQNLSPNSLIILGYSHEMVGNLDKALLAFKEAIKIAESNDAINGIISVMCKLGRLDEVINFINQLNRNHQERLFTADINTSDS